MPETSYYGGIQSITKDSLGRMWYTGPDALFMYDGNSFYQLNDMVSAIYPKVKWGYGTLITDKKGKLFLTTNHGLLAFDYEQFSFDLLVPGKMRSVSLHDDKLYMLSGDSILCYDQKSKKLDGFRLSTDKFISNVISLDGRLYVSQEGLLYQVDMAKRGLKLFADFGSAANTVNDAVEYQGRYYFLTQRGGIHVTDGAGAVQHHVSVASSGNLSALSKKLFIDQTGVIWVATQVGLFLYDPTTESRSFLRLNLNDDFSPPNNSIWTIHADPDQGAWIGTYGGKIAYCSLYDARVRYFNPSAGGLNHPVVSGFQEDHLRNIWIGTEGGGLNYWDRTNDSFRHFVVSKSNSPNSNMIKRLKFDADNKTLLISAFSGGMMSYNMDQNVFNDFRFFFPGSQVPLTIYDFVQDDQGSWWMSDPDKSFIYKRTNRHIEMVKVLGENNNKLDLEVEALYMDRYDNLRLVTHQGLYVVDRNTLNVLKHYVIQDAPYSANYLCSYHEASNGDLWLGTLGRGVNVLKKDGTYLNYNANNGFPAKMVFGILEDDVSKNIWLSTSEGLYYYDQELQVFEKARFYQENNCGSFYIRAAFKTQQGEMLFGGTNGFLLFDPAYLNKNPQKPRVFFTGFFVNNRRVTVNSSNSPLSKDISSLSNHKDEKIILSSKQSNIEIRFSTDSYLAADKNQFAYRMRGLGDKWLSINTNQKSVQFFNLPSGDYTFEIKASNNDGLWGDEISRLYLHVDPPFFLSWWAYCSYAIVAFALLFFIIRYYTNKKVYKERLALQVLKEKNMRELNQARTDFFTNISHDLKTPLTLVLQPLKQLKESLVTNDHAIGYMQHIEKNISRIQRMISQLLRFREIESQKITLNPQVGDFINFVRDVFGLFELYAYKKEIETSIATYKDHVYVAFDYDVVEKILTNLFSNALKYTPNKGYVGVRIYESTEEELTKLSRDPDERGIEYISIEVLNSGDGFSEQQIATLFTSFNRLSPHRPTFEESSGLGLAIVKELVNALEGRIWMVNKTDKISFTILFGLKKDTGSGDLQGNVYDYTVSEIDDIMLDTASREGTVKNPRKANSLLLIEDDPAMRTYLEERLSEKYNVYTASDGMEGITKAEKIYPQLIITDLIMPHCNGFEVCRRLRQNFKTSHIPIVMISGMGDDNQNKIKALEYGANVFIDKPFDVEYLLQQTGTILKNQQELKEKYSKRVTVDPSKVTITSMDEELLVKAMKLIELNIANPNYSVDDFVSDMNVGRTVLYQKINDIVGMSIKEFILNIRLKRSAYLLEQSDLTVAEIAYQTGFNNAKYFSVCFKKQFEMSPSEFKKKSSGLTPKLNSDDHAEMD
ncbi:response regulator [Sphingobacterium alkalisoli]|uniref:histidine kinase n=2 Tax=Sphingobacterium alkalisoli TaxID=1874115 RepID=A0A4U0HA75_9SPHI|nr:response regulator [Sphingobacterium alkalisoli]GGH06713.1 hybrid sensor histidine kinase/response regulator [Sphingobacterium alkalisoli]